MRSACLWILCVIIQWERGGCAAWQGRPAARLTSLAAPLHVVLAATWDTALVSGLCDPTHCFCLGWKQSDMAAVYYLAQSRGGSITEFLGFSFWGTPHSHSEGYSRPLPPSLSASPAFEVLLKLILYSVGASGYGFPISSLSELLQGFLIIYLHIKDPFWFHSLL